jgi:colicin import membrane protein
MATSPFTEKPQMLKKSLIASVLAIATLGAFAQAPATPVTPTNSTVPAKAPDAAKEKREELRKKVMEERKAKHEAEKAKREVAKAKHAEMKAKQDAEKAKRDEAKTAHAKEKADRAAAKVAPASSVVKP